MRYRQLDGYESIVAMEAETCLEKEDEQFRQEPSRKLPVPEEGRKVKAVHIGYPVGGIFVPSVLEKDFCTAILTEKQLMAGSTEIQILYDDTCIVDYMLRLTEELRGESCGRCVLCREGLRQISAILKDLTNGKASADDLNLIRIVAEGMAEGANCLFGRSVGRMWLEVMEQFAEEFELHTRKRCPAMVCKRYMTYLILGSKCRGCGECMDICESDAIEGKPGYIHMIDEFECGRCGKCMEACGNQAVILAGAVKPKTPVTVMRADAGCILIC